MREVFHYFCINSRISTIILSLCVSSSSRHKHLSITRDSYDRNSLELTFPTSQHDGGPRYPALSCVRPRDQQTDWLRALYRDLAAGEGQIIPVMAALSPQGAGSRQEFKTRLLGLVFCKQLHGSFNSAFECDYQRCFIVSRVTRASAVFVLAADNTFVLVLLVVMWWYSCCCCCFLVSLIFPRLILR